MSVEGGLDHLVLLLATLEDGLDERVLTGLRADVRVLSLILLLLFLLFLPASLDEGLQNHGV